MSVVTPLNPNDIEPVPPELEAELTLFRRAAADGAQNFLGTELRFREGRFYKHVSAGNETAKTEVPLGTRLVALMAEFRRGWVRWQKGQRPERLIGKVADASFEVPDRNTLGDLDDNRWPIGLSGRKEDPWQFTVYAPLLALDGEVMTFTSHYDNGKAAFHRLMHLYGVEGRRHPWMFPIVDLGAYSKVNSRGNTTHFPTLEIVDWTERPESVALSDAGSVTALPAPTTTTLRGGDMDDEIPF